MNLYLNKIITIASQKSNPQKKSSQSIIPSSKLVNKSLSYSMASIQQSIQKSRPPLNIHPSHITFPDFQVPNLAEIQLNLPSQNTNHNISENDQTLPQAVIKNKAQQNEQIKKLPKKSIRPATANPSTLKKSIHLTTTHSSQPKQPVHPTTASSMNFSKKTPPQNNIDRPQSALTFDSKNKQIKQNTFKLTKPSSINSSTVLMIKKQNGDLLRNIISAKSSISKSKIQVNPKLQQISYSQQMNISKPIILEKEQRIELIEEEEEKEGFDFYQKEQDCNIDEIEVKNIFQGENKENEFQILQQLDNSVPELHRPLFEVIDYDIILKIANFLTIRDLIKLATLSRQARSLVALVLVKINFQKNLKEYQENYHSIQNASKAVESIRKIQQSFNSILNNQNLEKEFLNYLSKNAKNEYCIFAILKAGMNFSENKLNSNIDVISNIKKNGIFNCFSGINLPFIPPSNLKISFPAFIKKKSNQCEQLIQVISQYVEFRKSNRSSIKSQKSANQQIELYQIRSQLAKNQLKLSALYSKPIQRLSKNSKIFDYINKNTLQAIIQFLTFKEIAILYQSGKLMRDVVKSVVQNQLTYLESKRLDQLQLINISSQLGNGLLYAKQFEQFEKEELTYIKSHRFSFTPLCEQLKAICFAVTSKTLEEIDTQFQVSPTIMYKIEFNKTIPDSKRLLLINTFLENYPNLKEFKQKRFNDQNISQIDERECILLYQAMKGYQQLSQFRYNQYNFGEAYELYSSSISPLDKIIFKYQRLLGINEDELFMLPKLELSKEPIIFDGEVFLLFPN